MTFNPRTIVLGGDGRALPDEPFLLGSAATQRTFWHWVARRGSANPPTDHPHLGLGYGQDEPVAQLAAEPRQAGSGAQVELVSTAAEAGAEPAVGDGTTPDPHDEEQRDDLEGAGELEPDSYRVTIEIIGFDQRGPANVSTRFEVTGD